MNDQFPNTAPHTASHTAWFFGTFNPVHNGHLYVARAVLAAFGAFETVTFVPAGQPPHKTPAAVDLAPAEDRLAMVRLAVAGEPAFRVSDVEITGPQPCYTFETLLRLGLTGLAEPPGLIIGVDAFNGLATWHRAAELLAAAHFLVAPRAGIAPKSCFEIAGNLIEPCFSMIPMAEVPLSSSEIRRALREDLPLVDSRGNSLMPEPVRHYIVSRRLYRTPLRVRP